MSEPKTRVLLVEDNAADARLLCELLAEVPKQPFDVTVVGTLAEAVAAVPGHDVALLDLSLPDAHGVTTITRMAEAPGAAPVIVLTGNTDDEVAAQAVALGADDYLLKSEVTPSLVARTILYTIERRRGAENARRVLALEIARAESLRAAERARFLADLSVAFASRLNVREVAEAAAHHVVPELGDFSIVDIVKEGDGLERVAAHAADASLQEKVQRVLAFKPRAPNPILRAARESRVVDLPNLGDVLEEIVPEPEHRAAIRALEAASALVLPLVNRDRPLGVLTLAARPGRQFDEDRQALAEEVARRTAIAIDNALLYEATQRALHAREEMLAVVSHDLRNPLSVLSLALHALGRAVDTQTVPSRELVAKGTRAIARMERLIDDLLEVARIDAGTLTINKTNIDVVAVLREAVEQNAALAAEKKIKVETHFVPSAETHADRDRLMQVVANLFSNALKFTPAGGRIAITCATYPESVYVSVADSGPGVPPTSVPHVFDRFYQSDKRRGGVGLGLTIAKGIIDAHGGSIGVENEPGSGARFWFELPMTEAQAVA